MRPLPRVFVSFCSKDEDFVRHLAADLDATNPHMLWRQGAKNGAAAGSKYKDGLSCCSVVCAIVSTAYCGNAKCMGQLQAAAAAAAQGQRSLVIVYYDPEDLVRAALLVEHRDLLHAIRTSPAVTAVDFSGRDEMSADILPGDYADAFAALYRAIFERLQGPEQDLAEAGRAFDRGLQALQRLVQRATDEVVRGGRSTPEAQEAAAREVALALAELMEAMGHEDSPQFLAYLNALRGARLELFLAAARDAADEAAAALARLAGSLAEAARARWAPGPPLDRALAAREGLLRLARRVAASERARPGSSERPASRASGGGGRSGLQSRGAASAASLGAGSARAAGASAQGSARSSPSPPPGAESPPGGERAPSPALSQSRSAPGLVGPAAGSPVKIGRLVRPLSEVLETAKRLTEDAQRRSEEQKRLEMERWAAVHKESQPYRGEEGRTPVDVDEITMRLYKEAEHKSKERDKLTENRTKEFKSRATTEGGADAAAFQERMQHDIAYRRGHAILCQKNHGRPGGGDVRPSTVPSDPGDPKSRALAAKKGGGVVPFEPTRFEESEFLGRMTADIKQKKAQLEAFEAKCTGDKTPLLVSLCTHPAGGVRDGVPPEKCMRARERPNTAAQFDAIRREWVENSDKIRAACRHEYQNVPEPWGTYVRRDFSRCLFAKKAAAALAGAADDDAAARALLGGASAA